MKSVSFIASLFCLYYLFVPSALMAGPREMVCVVRPVLESDIRDSLVLVADELDRNGQQEIGDFFRAYSKGGFGSGFLYMDKNGNCFVVTNRHVVAMARSVTLEFNREDGSTVKYDECPVLYADDAVDLAVIGFPGGKKPFARGLALYNGGINDGGEVWAAGFPALFNNPSWQFSKGNITNKRVVINDVAEVGGTWFIQHSATIDNGNSGGPLLIKAAGRNDFSVVGVNTWSLSGRQNTFFSIPASRIDGVAQSAAKIRSRSEKQIDAILIETCRDLASSFNQSFKTAKDESRFISYSYAARNGLKDFFTVVSSLDKAESEAFDRKLHKGVPIDVFRQASFERMRLGVTRSEKNARLEFVKIEQAPSEGQDGRRARALFSIAGDQVYMEMKWENGHWRILETDIDRIYKRNAFVSSPLNSDYPTNEYGFAFSFSGGMHWWNNFIEKDAAVYSGTLSIVGERSHVRNYLDVFFEYIPSASVRGDEWSSPSSGSIYGGGLFYGYGYAFGDSSWIIRPILGAKLGGVVLGPMDFGMDMSFIARGLVGLEYRISDSFALGLEVTGDARFSFFAEEPVNTVWYTGQAGLYFRIIY